MVTDFTDLMKPQMELDELLAKLDFTEEMVPHAVLEQPKLLLEAVRYRIVRMKRRIAAERNEELVRVKKALKLRLDKASRGDKLTEPHIKETVLSDPKVREAQDKYDQCKIIEEFAKLVLDTFYERGKSLKIFGEIRATEMGSREKAWMAEQASADFQKKKNEVRKKYPGRRIAADEEE